MAGRTFQSKENVMGNTINCAECGAAMNHHAVKIDYSSEKPNPDFGGALKDVYTCPVCGAVEMKAAE
jgi:hypothetical protein